MGKAYYVLKNKKQNAFLAECNQLTKDESKAIKFRNLASAENYLKSSCPPVLRKDYSSLSSSTIAKIEAKAEKDPAMEDFKVELSGFTYKTDHKKFDNAGIESASKFLNNTLTYLQNLDKRSEELGKQLSEYDRQVIDLYHKIEFTNLNAKDGYKIYKVLQGTLQKRREIKNEIKAIRGVKAVNIDTKALMSTIISMEDMHNPVYKTRSQFYQEEENLDDND